MFGVRCEDKSFWRDQNGAIILLFALCLPLVLGFAGLGFDYVRAAIIQQRLQQASDAAVLAGAASRGDEDQRRTIAEKVFAANYGRGWLAPGATPEVVFSDEGRVVVTAAAGFVPTFLTGIGQERVEMAAAGVAKRKAIDLEVVLVIDTTGSMKHNAGNGRTRIEALRMAAHRLIDTILASKPPGTSFKLAIVPFNSTVNVGTGNTGFVKERLHALFAGTSWRGCVLERGGVHAFSDAYSPVSAGADGKWHAYVAPPEPNKPPSGLSWACDNPSNGTMNGYRKITEPPPNATHVYYNGPNFGCTTHALMPLTDTVAAMRSKIDTLTPVTGGSTFAAPGISWGMRTLSPGEPFTEGAAYDKNTHKVLILMTDGEQGSYPPPSCSQSTNSPSTYHFAPSTLGLDGSVLGPYGPDELFTPYGYVLESNPFGESATTSRERHNQILRKACAAAKEQGVTQEAPIEIFSVAFSNDVAVGGVTEATLKACASDPNTNYFHAITGSELDDDFQEIASELLKVRLTR